MLDKKIALVSILQMHKKFVSTDTIPLRITQAQFHILAQLYERPNLLNEFPIRTEAEAKQRAMKKRYVHSMAWQLHDMMLCVIDKTRFVELTPAGEAVLEGRPVNLHYLIRQDTKD